LYITRWWCGGHWRKWSEDPNSENARFAYVASSRPKYLLVWALPKRSLDKEGMQKLTELGFSEAQNYPDFEFGNFDRQKHHPAIEYRYDIRAPREK